MNTRRDYLGTQVTREWSYVDDMDDIDIILKLRGSFQKVNVKKHKIFDSLVAGSFGYLNHEYYQSNLAFT